MHPLLRMCPRPECPAERNWRACLAYYGAHPELPQTKVYWRYACPAPECEKFFQRLFHSNPCELSLTDEVNEAARPPTKARADPRD